MPPTGPRRWPLYNQRVYPPTAPDEPARPAFVCHVKTDVKYSQKKMWYIASMIRGMSIEEALKQLKFVNKKGAKIATEALLEAQDMAVKFHNVEFKNNLWVAESFATKARVLKGLRRHARVRVGVVHYRYTHYFLRLEEGAPPEQYYTDAPLPPEEMLRQWLEQRRSKTIVHSL
ncbi:39S ribosomal protein L22, mitochondrial-like [Pollicipes pollicipes]|uniref:39S ribosomal protein L22, mitochondrial-like n=1 Tax=Pollicipes pollicipes TaxID=41117 RepID=UPI001885957E|nr:39S ribosomal protein L22, mitochondrial-like [Pollicipes pollicipes]